ncbi:hypothetical protein [Parabacteroides provencensis]|uniref:hypothetical protein n=1 Tax=Parabacteroides provencensis TaxID=1944636 RepID=UPI000C153110|nr:hypothetical protein [Parabacteroides provencensis]
MRYKSNAFNRTITKRKYFFITFASIMNERQTELTRFSLLFDQFKEPFILFANSCARDMAATEGTVLIPMI